MRTIPGVLMLLVFLIPGLAFSSVPDQVNFQGVLLDNNNQVVTGNVDFSFTLFDADNAGTSLWSESQTAIPDALASCTAYQRYYCFGE